MRISKKQKIMDYCKGKGFGENAILFLTKILELSDYGVIENYVGSHHQNVINNTFSGNSTNYFEAYKLLNKEKIIELKGSRLAILAWDDQHLYSLSHNISGRKYSKDHAHEQVSLQVNLDKYMKENMNKPVNVLPAEKKSEKCVKLEIKWNKVMGIKFPRSLSSLLTGKESEEHFSPDSKIKSSIKLNLAKEEKRYLCGLIAQSIDGDISDFNLARAIEEMQLSIFDDGAMAASTCYDVHKKLLEKGIIKEIPHKGVKCLRISGYSEGFGSGRNYIVIPYAVFQGVFKHLESSAIKLFFDVVFKHNNGENGKGKVDKNKPIIFKMFDTSSDNRDDRARFKNTLIWLHRRCRKEMYEVVFGKGGSQSLRHFFDFDLGDISRGIVKLRLKGSYFISKLEAKNIERVFNPTNRYPAKAKVIKQALEECSFEYSESDVQGFVTVLRHAAARVIRQLIGNLEEDIRKRKQKGWSMIQSLPGYVSWLYDRYMEGDRVKFTSRIGELLKTKEEVMERLSEDMNDGVAFA